MSLYPSTKRTLLERIQSGDDVSWQEFYDRYAPVIRIIGKRYELSEVECDDVVQNIMLKFFQKELILKYQSQKAKFRTYFHRVTMSCIIDYKRSHARIQEEGQSVLPDVPVNGHDPDQVFMDAWRDQMFQEALEQLRNRVDPQNFLAFQLIALREKSAAETAAFLGMDVSRVYVAKSRCISMMREIVQNLNQEDAELKLIWNESKSK